MGEIAINPTHNIHKKYRTMNLVNPYFFTPAVTYNTYIGGVSASISTAALLATKLGISVGAISNFTVVGSDIKCKITGSYAMGLGIWINALITYFYDYDGLVSSLGSECFKGSTILKSYFPNVTSTGYSVFLVTTNYTTEYIYIPRCTNLGGTSANNSCFAAIRLGTLIYVHPSLATNNGGSPDADLVSAISQGAIVRYVTNFTLPIAVNDLTAGTIYNTAIQMNFTPPVGSANAIEFYECWVDGKYQNTIASSGEYVIGLSPSTSYSIVVYAVDIFRNLSLVSNSLSASTNTTNPTTPTTGLVSYYKLDSDTSDSINSRNGTDVAISFTAGKINNGALFNGTTSKSTINLSSLVTTKASINFWVKLAVHTPATAAKGGLMKINTEDQDTFYPFTNGVMYIGLLTSVRKTIGAGIVTNRAAWHMCTVTADTTNNQWCFYQNGILIFSSTVGTLSLLSASTFGKAGAAYYLDGQLDEIPLYNKVLSKNEIAFLYNSGSGITL